MLRYNQWRTNRTQTAEGTASDSLVYLSGF